MADKRNYPIFNETPAAIKATTTGDGISPSWLNASSGNCD
jgi:hypothetical protein